MLTSIQHRCYYWSPKKQRQGRQMYSKDHSAPHGAGDGESWTPKLVGDRGEGETHNAHPSWAIYREGVR